MNLLIKQRSKLFIFNLKSRSPQYCYISSFNSHTPLLIQTFYWSISKRFTGGRVVLYTAKNLPSENQLVKFRQIIDVTSNQREAIIKNRALIPYHPHEIAQDSKSYSEELALKIKLYNHAASNDIVARGSKILIHHIQKNVTTFENLNDIKMLLEYKHQNREKISDNYLNAMLKSFKYLSDLKLLTVEHHYLLHALRYYFEILPPNLEISELFLDIWKNAEGLTYTHLHPLSKLNSSTTMDSNKENVKKDIKSLSDIQEVYQEGLDNIKKIHNIMSDLFLKHQNNPQEIINSETLYEWYKYLETRSNVIIVPISEKEIDIYNTLKKIQENYAPKQEEILQTEKDNLKYLKDKSSLPDHLKQKALKLEECFLPEDYELEINNIRESLEVLKNDKDLSINDLKLLSINSSAISVDEEGKLKVTIEGYNTLKKNQEAFNFQYLNGYPNAEHILSQIRNNEFVVAKEIPSVPDAITAVAHLSHKTLIVKDNISGNNVLVRIGMNTSTLNNTLKLDNKQYTNPDPIKQLKEQRFRCFTQFIVVDKNEPLNIDIEMTLYLQSKNDAGENIVDLLLDKYIAEKNVWSENKYQLTYTVNHDLVRKLTILFYEKKLQDLLIAQKELNDEFQILIKTQDPTQIIAKIRELELMKNKNIEEKRNQRYFSLLPKSFQRLENSLRHFEEILKQNQEKQKKKQNKLHKKIFEETYKKKKEEEQQPSTEKTAAQKKKEYLQNKQQEKKYNENENNT